MSDIDRIVGHNIKRLREPRGFTQGDLAAYLEVDQSLISKIENGQRSAGVSFLERLGDLFFCPLDDFLEEATGNKPTPALSFRAKGFNESDFQAIAAMGRLVRNLEEMTALEEALNGR